MYSNTAPVTQTTDSGTGGNYFAPIYRMPNYIVEWEVPEPKKPDPRPKMIRIPRQRKNRGTRTDNAAHQRFKRMI